ncbi:MULTISPECIES: AAA family ATPase [unclassified Thiocapsa]|uniref:AAA family ATPase n=1 Tax=unclassified Thiocapsa TaxID=2641286 RepID=UPI0035B41ECF
MKISSVSTQHFRAFGCANLPIRPLTVLVGANGLGKSSLFHPLLLLKQSFDKLNKSTPYDIHVNGKYLTYGEARNAFHRLDESEDLVISLNLVETDFIRRVRAYQKRAYDDASRAARGMFREVEYLASKASRIQKRPKDIQENIEAFLSKMSRKSSQIFDGEKDAGRLIQLLREIENLASRSQLKGTDYWDAEFSSSFSTDGLKSIISELSKLSSFLTNLESLGDGEFMLRFVCANLPDDRQKGLRVKCVSIYRQGMTLVSATYKEGRVLSVSSDLAGVSSDAIAEAFDLRKFGDCSVLDYFINLPDDHVDNQFSQCLLTLLHSALVILQQVTTEKLAHIGAFRASPLRYYDQGAVDHNKERTIHLINSLLESPGMKKNISDWWLQRSNVSFDGREIEGSLHSLVVHPKWLGSDQILTIMDTGHGYSQILPIMADILAAPVGSIIIVEQPEAHLHPNLHPEIADWIITRALDTPQRLQLIVETHSEYFLRRVLRRVVEGTLKEDMVAILTVEEDENNGAPVVREQVVSRADGFSWPKGFYEKTLEDNLAIGRALK